ncbi:MAG: ATP-grasp domain-containing protein [Candidatus Nanopelagicales bacterium]
MNRVALVTADPESSGEVDADLPALRTALEKLDIAVATPDWRDAGVDWSMFDVAVLRSTWDYSLFPEEFQQWLADVSVSTRVLNCAQVIGWNLGKEYMTELHRRGIAVVPTTLAATAEQVTARLADVDAPAVVVKPTVSAGSRDTGLFTVGDPAAQELGEAILALGKTVMIQPAIPSVATEGELALILFDGVRSHAVSKGPLLQHGGGLIGGEYTEVIAPVEPTPEQWDLAEAATTAAVEAIGHRDCCADQSLLYARIDIVAGQDGEPLVLEAELFEPSLFIDTAVDSADRFAAAVLRRLRAGRPR